MKRTGLPRRWLGHLGAALAALLIVLAVLVGIARLLLPLVPEYQDEIRRFTAAATGLDVEFAGVSASWPLPGPAILFRDVQVFTAVDRKPVFDAREFSVGINLLQLFAEQKLTPGRISVRGVRLVVERAADGTVLFNTIPADELFRGQQDEALLSRLDLDLRDIELVVLDRSRLEPRAGFLIDQANLRLRSRHTDFSGYFVPRDGLGRSLQVSGTAPFGLDAPPAVDGDEGTGDGRRPLREWSVSAGGVDIDAARLLRMVLDRPAPLQSGRGELQFDGRFAGTDVREMRMDIDLANAVLDSVAPDEGRYARLRLRAHWLHHANGWDAGVDHLDWQRGQGFAPPVRLVAAYRDADGGSLSVSSDRLPLDAIWRLVWAFAGVGARRDLVPERLHGEIRDVDLTIRPAAGGAPHWQLGATLQDAGIVMPAPGFAVTGVSGAVTADQDGGRLRIDSQAGLVRLPEWFRSDLHTVAAAGSLAWKDGDSGLTVFGDRLRVVTPDGEIQGRVQLDFPRGSTPMIDLTARIRADAAPAVIDYLPLRKFRPSVVKWLDDAIIDGRIPRAELLWQGPVRGVPYANGDGRFRVEFAVEDGIVDYAPRWPRLEGLNATVLIETVSLVSLENEATLAGLPLQDVEVRVPSFVDEPGVDIAATEQVRLPQLLAFIRRTPIADAIGPVAGSLTTSGNARAQLKVSVPFGAPDDFHVSGTFDVERGSLGLRESALELTELSGRVALADTRLSASKLDGRFLDESVTISLRPAAVGETDFSHLAFVSGETPVEKLTAAFSLPYADRLLGTVDWTSRVRFPDRDSGQPLSIEVDSDLDGLLSTLASPLEKAAGTVDPLALDIRLPERDRLEIDGWLGRGLAWRLQLSAAPPGQSGPPSISPAPDTSRAGGVQDRWLLQRGAFRGDPDSDSTRGGPLPALPVDPGLAISGNFASLRFEDWITGGPRTAPSPGAEWRQAQLEVGEFSIFGQMFRGLRIDGERVGETWDVAVEGRGASGTLRVPPAGPEPLLVTLDRLWLEETDPGSTPGSADPRNVPSTIANITDFRMNDMRFGHLTATVNRQRDGITVAPLRTEMPSFTIDGDAAWVVTADDATRQRSELRLQLVSGAIEPTLQALGYDPVVDGRNARMSMDLAWPGAPSADFLNVARGRVTVMMDDGQFLAVEPGGGRLVGLLSIAALPRRLGMDFRDVLDEGLAFDEVRGEFRLEGGNAFTCNLGLQGPVADLGIVGRTGLADRDYEQIAVARPHVSDVLALGGVVVGGPVIGGAVLLISQIFRKPLSSLGETYYQVRGSWDNPEVRRVQRSDIDVTPFRDCERYLAEVLQDVRPESPPASPERQE